MKKALILALLLMASTHSFAQGHRYRAPVHRGYRVRYAYMPVPFCPVLPRVMMSCAPPLIPTIAAPASCRGTGAAHPQPLGEPVIKEQPFFKLEERYGTSSIGNRSQFYKDYAGTVPATLEKLPVALGIGYAEYLASDPAENSLDKNRDNAILTEKGPIFITWGTTTWFIRFPSESLSGKAEVSNVRLFSLGR